jgi:excisionase family DNA binding protein
MARASKKISVVPAVQPRLLTIRAAAAYLSASVWAIRTLAWSQAVPYVKIGNRILFDRADLDAYVERAKFGVA